MKVFLGDIEASFHQATSVDSSELLELQTWPYLEEEEDELFGSKDTFVTCQTHISNEGDAHYEYCSSSSQEIAQQIAA